MNDKDIGKIPCPDCNGQGIYLKREGRGFYADGSFGHNQWEDCNPCCGTGDARERLDYHYPKENTDEQG